MAYFFKKIILSISYLNIPEWPVTKILHCIFELWKEFIKLEIDTKIDEVGRMTDDSDGNRWYR